MPTAHSLAPVLSVLLAIAVRARQRRAGRRADALTVHTVAYTDNEWFRDQLQIAEVTGGHFERLK